MKDKHIQIGEIELTTDYFNLSEENKQDLCNGIMDMMLTLIDRNAPKHLNRVEILDKLLDSSIETNMENEEYEICGLLTKCKQILNESKD